MSSFKFELDRAGVGELLKNSEMMAICKEHADRALHTLGDGYEVTTHTGKTRVNASVHATSYKARRDAFDNNSIHKAVFGS